MPRGAAAVLLELLGKVPDAATLELLLEPEHLAQLLRANGWRDEDIRRDLKGGKTTPGELLLAVLAKQPDVRVLMDLLGNPTPKPAAAPQALTPAPSNAAGGPVARVLFGLLLAVPTAWYLFVRLDVLRVPGLIRHFPQVYAMLAALLVSGFYLVVSGIAGMRARRRAAS